MQSKLIKHKYGFYSIKNMPTQEELEEHYKNKYYQEEKSNYQKSYSEEELIFFENKAKVAEYVIGKKTKNRLLDVGAGEGFFSRYFYNLDWEVNLIDYSMDGVNKHNSTLLNYLRQGDIFELLQDDIVSGEKYTFINIANVLEHVLEPIDLVQDLKNLLEEDGILRIVVPNDYSSFQNFLLNKKYTLETWYCPPEHLHYFNNESLEKLLINEGYEVVKVLNEFPIEFFLANNSSRYSNDFEKGKDAHIARIEIDNFLFSEGVEKYIEYYQASALMGIGRQIVIYVKNRKKNENH